MGCCGASIRSQDQTKAPCMDFRLVDDYVYYLDSLGLNNNYDQFVLAGSSLGFTQDKYPEWGKTLLAHMSIAQSLHNFREIIFIDHKDCGAFKKFYPQINASNEVELHTKHIQMAQDKLAAVFPNFKFRGFLMDIDGKCTEIPVISKEKVDPSKVKQDQFLTTLKH